MNLFVKQTNKQTTKQTLKPASNKFFRIFHENPQLRANRCRKLRATYYS